MSDQDPNCLEKLLVEDTSGEPFVKRVYQKIIFLSQPKHMLWVLKRTVTLKWLF